MILAILLVCYSSRGHQLVFSYPFRPSTSVSTSSDDPGGGGCTSDATAGVPSACSQYPYDSLSGPPPLTPSDDFGPNSHDGARHGDREHGGGREDTILGFDPQSLSDLLSPKVALCDRKFQLTVDDITFVGHPTLLNADRPGTGHRFARMIQKKRLSDLNANAGGGGGVAAAAGLAAAGAKRDVGVGEMDATGAVQSNLDTLEEGEKVNAADAVAGAKSKSPRPPPATVNSTRHPGTGAASATSATGTAPPLNPSSQQLTMFNLVMALRSDGSNTLTTRSGSSDFVDVIYENVISQLTAGLKYEQLKRAYIRKEAELILGIREELHQTLNSAGLGNGGGWSWNGMRRILNESSLARLLAHTFHSIKRGGGSIAHVVVNSSIDLSMQIPDLTARTSPHSYNPFLTTSLTGPGANGSGTPGNPGGLGLLNMGGHHSHLPDRISSPHSSLASNPIVANLLHVELRPYHALLLLFDAEEILSKMLPADASPLLMELIEVVTPTQSFEELALVLSCSLSQLFRLASHLVYWKMAKVVDVIHPRNVYIVSRDLSASTLKSLEAEFSSKMPTLHFLGILASLSSPQPYSAIFPSKDSRNSYMEVIAFFLRNNLVKQLRMVIYIVFPRRIQPDSESAFESGTVEGGGEKEDYVILTESDERHQEWIQILTLRQPPNIGSLFQRLAPYFNGRYHTEEIIFRESISRKEFKLVLRC
ncbi:Nitrogen permease regulator 3 [Irineochytrium annulatum]|nr:Nitrogen permease regulator 3 [Irineochytrium annulatum]